MCIAVVAWQSNPDHPIVVIANRDELHERPTAPLSLWEEGNGIIAGRDLQSGGTWLGVSENTGRLALVTNFRDPDGPHPDAPSRGALVTDWLSGSWSAIGDRKDDLSSYNGFSLILIDGDQGWILDNRTMTGPMAMTASGFYGLSNGPFAEPWPKVGRLVSEMEQVLAREEASEERLFGLLAQPGPLVPADGADAPVFIRNPVYGTRCSTVVRIDSDGAGEIAERRFDAKGTQCGETTIPFRWPA